MLLAKLAAGVLASDAERGWRREQVPQDVFEALVTRTWPGRAYVGDHSLTLESDRLRFVSDDSPLVTDGEVARAYLRRVARGAGLKTFNAGGSGGAPLPAVPRWHHRDVVGELALVDLRHAYHEIMAGTPLDSTCCPLASVAAGRAVIGIGRARADPGEWAEIGEDRSVRLHLWSTLRARSIAWLLNGEMQSYPGLTRWSAPGVSQLVMLILAAIARDVHDGWPECTSWHVDGGILPADQAGDLVAWLAASWGIDATVKAIGPGQTFGIGRWRIAGSGAGVRVSTGRRVDSVLELGTGMRESLRAWRWAAIKEDWGDGSRWTDQPLASRGHGRSESPTHQPAGLPAGVPPESDSRGGPGSVANLRNSGLGQGAVEGSRPAGQRQAGGWG